MYDPTVLMYADGFHPGTDCCAMAGTGTQFTPSLEP